MTAAHRIPSALLESRIESPLGPLRLLSLDDAVCYLGFDADVEDKEFLSWKRRYLAAWETMPAAYAHDAVREQLNRYFDGTLKRFRVKTHLFGTDFQLQVWTALRGIAYGATSTYSAIGEGIGNPNASRAVGQATGRNPISIIIPCHRVIGEDGSLVGYAGGVERKKYLLRIEGSVLM